jgi:hypothetical protein
LIRNAITQNVVFGKRKDANKTMWEQIVVGLLFVSAIAYVGNRLRGEFIKKKSGCNKGCGCE